MAKEKERFEVLLEEIKSDVKAVLDGHAVLYKKLDDVKEMVKAVDIKVEDTQKAVSAISRQLNEHIHLPAHV